MGFLSGPVTLECFRVGGEQPRQFGPEHVKILERFAIGQIETSSPEQADVGFLAGRHLLDLDFGLEKNVIGETLHFAVRIDTNQIPAAVRKAWLQMELAVATADIPPVGPPRSSVRSRGKPSRRVAKRKPRAADFAGCSSSLCCGTPGRASCTSVGPVPQPANNAATCAPEPSISSWSRLPQAAAPRSGRQKPNGARHWKK